MAHFFQHVTGDMLDRIMGWNFNEDTNGDMSRLEDILDGGHLRLLRDAIICLLAKAAETNASMETIYDTMKSFSGASGKDFAGALIEHKEHVPLGLIFYAIRGLHAACAYELFPDHEAVLKASRTGGLTKAARG